MLHYLNLTPALSMPIFVCKQNDAFGHVPTHSPHAPPKPKTIFVNDITTRDLVVGMLYLQTVARELKLLYLHLYLYWV
jgi:hypothetical protein